MIIVINFERSTPTSHPLGMKAQRAFIPPPPWERAWGPQAPAPRNPSLRLVNGVAMFQRHCFAEHTLRRAILLLG